MASVPSTDFILNVVTPAGELFGTFSATAAEKVEQLISRLVLEEEQASGTIITLLLGNQPLLPNHPLGDYGVVSGASLTLLRVRQSQLQLVAFGCGHIYNLDAFSSWVAEDGSHAVQLRSGAVAWSRRFAEDVQDGSLAAVFCLQNPEWLQSVVDSGEVSKSEAVKTVLSSCIRSLLATGRLGNEGSGPGGAGEACDHEAATKVLSEHLPEATRGVNLLSRSIESHASLSEAFMKYYSEKYPEKAATERERVRTNLAGAFQLEPCEEMPMNIWSDEQGATVGWRQYLQEVERSCGCAGLPDVWVLPDGWIGFHRTLHSPNNMLFKTTSDEEVYTFFPSSFMIYQFGAGVYLKGEECGPSTLPKHYVVQWARTD